MTKRSFVSENDKAKKILLPVRNPSTQAVEEKYKMLEEKLEEEEESDLEVDETEDPNERPLTANDIIILQNEMKQTWPKRLANAAKRAMSHPEEHAHSAIRCFLTGLRKGVNSEINSFVE